MTRYLSLALGAAEPTFGQSIQELERAGGRPSADIRLSSELNSQVRAKIVQLGLDPSDTTGPELYRALHGRLQQDERYVRAALHIDEAATPEEVSRAVQAFLGKRHVNGSCFALKATTVRRMLKKKAPKATMKALGYRSIDSMLKHEHVAAIYTAAARLESDSWNRQLHEQYSKLKPSDFEQRPIAIIAPKSKHWQSFGMQLTAETKHTMRVFKELGTVVILPASEDIDGLAITSMLFGLHYMNDIRAYSSYLKLQQVKPDFGQLISQASYGEPMTSAALAGQPVAWRVIQRYYGRLAAAVHPDVFEPHIQSEDLQWKDAEDVLAQLTPALAFWKGTQYVCTLHDGQPVSMNILDVALSYCNHLGFADRIVHFMREHLWHELMSRYLHQENLETAVHRQLSADLMPGQALAEF